MLARIKAIFRNSEARLDEELRGHMEMLTADYRRRGLSPDAAQRAARREMGGLTQVRELHRERRRLPGIDSITQDVHYAVRQLRANPAFTIAAVLTLALGIGANTAIYQVLDAVVFRSLPVRDPQKLVRIDLSKDGRSQPFSYPLFREMAARQNSLEGMFAVSSFPLHEAVLRGHGPLKTISGVLVSGDYFRVLGALPRVGRVFNADDDRAGAAAAVISHRFCENEFERCEESIGKTLVINRAVVKIIGVMAPQFFGETLGKYPDVWLPMSLQPMVMASDWLDAPYSSWLEVVGRLHPNTPRKQAQAALDALYQPLANLNIRTRGHYQIELRPADRGIDELAGFARPLWFMMATVGLVLLIACCNLANLLLSRAAGRSHEIGVRLALGAGRGRIVRQLLAESLLLSGIGSLLAIAIAWRASRALLLLAGDKPWEVPLDFGWRAGAFTAAAAIATAILFGLAPALTATRVDVHAALQGARRSQTDSRSRHLAGRMLVMAQISISLVLLTGAALLTRSFWNLRHQDFGFRPERVLNVSLPVEFNKSMMERNKQVQRPLLERLSAIPGVRMAALSAFGPMSSFQHTGYVSLPGRPARESDYVRLAHVTPEYFEAMGIPIVGRPITQEDREGTPKIAVLSQTAAAALFGAENPLDRMVSGAREYDSRDTFRVVGVARDVRFTPRDPSAFLVYFPIAQNPAPVTEAILRVAGDPSALSGTVRAAIRQVDPGLPVGEIQPLSDLLDRAVAHEKAIAALSACFGLVALALTAIGVYGVLTYSVKGRTQEIGIRLALGAGRRQVSALLIRDLALPAAASVLLGAAGGRFAVAAIQTQLFGAPRNGYVELAGAAILIALIAGVAGWLPARRASQLDPMTALREE